MLRRASLVSDDQTTRAVLVRRSFVRRWRLWLTASAKSYARQLQLVVKWRPNSPFALSAFG